MKKIIYFIIPFLLMGCGTDMNNTPTKKVEGFFASYQSLDEKVVDQLNDTANEEETFNSEQRKEYIELMKKHYQDLKYEIKDEIVDGDEATVTVEVEVKDYSKVMEDADDYLDTNKDEFNDATGKYDESLFTTYRINKLKETKDRVKYTIDVTLTKVDKEWKINDLSENDRMKIHGLYNK